MAGPELSQSPNLRLEGRLSPQMQHSLKILQAPVLDLSALVREEIEMNPTLEESPPTEIEPSADEADELETQAEMEFAKEFEVLAKLDDEWREYFAQEGGVRRVTSEDEERRQFFMDSITQPESLADHLLAQMRAFGLETSRETAVELVIGSLDERGYLPTPLEDLVLASGQTLQELQGALAWVQTLHPVGVGARDLRECLLLQLERLGKSGDLEAAIVRDYLAALAEKKYDAIATALQKSPEEVRQAAIFIATLDPHPGSRISAEPDQYVVPDLHVEKTEGGNYAVILNDEQIPRLRISDTYKELMGEAHQSKEVKEYVRQKIQAGKFLIKSIHQRQQTIFKIATEMVRHQREFLEQGISQLKPLTMAEVAAVVGLHETTVGRAIAGKYMQTPRGLFEMKYFFTPGIKTASGQMISTTSIKDVIADLIQNEDRTRPLSDQVIVERLAERGIPLARRTVAKYRDELKILPGSLRKQSA